VDKLFEPPSERVRQEHELYVSARVVENSCELELSVWRGEPEGPVHARARVAREDRFLEEFAALRAADPTASWESICIPDLLRVVEMTSIMMPELSRKVVELRDLQVSPVLDSVLIIHGLIYDIWISSGFAESAFHFHAPGRPRPPRRDLHPLDAWIEDVRNLIGVRGCEIKAIDGPSET
jgi:hypothetical protein